MLRCAYGGEFKSIDPIIPTTIRNHGNMVYDILLIIPGFRTRQCFSCGKLRKQKVRVSKKEQTNASSSS